MPLASLSKAGTGLRIILAAVFIVISSCAAAQSAGRTARNVPLCPTGTVPQYPADILTMLKECRPAAGGSPVPIPKQAVPRARIEFATTDQDVPEFFIGLSISGGGSRAAAFGMAVMRQLHELGILQHVSAISTTSGGGLPGAYYAINGPTMDWDKAQDLMAVDYLTPWIKKNFSLGALGNVLFTNEDRSDLMTDLLDERLFKKATYGSLGAFSPGKAPIWLANATVSGYERRFTFSETSFNGIHSDLKKFPIAQAVQASAAFPAAFNTVTLFDFRASSPGAPVSVNQPATYTHIYDGGPTDNLGTEALLTLAKSHRFARPSPRYSEERARLGQCLMIVVDAYPRGVPDRYDLKEDLRGTAGRLIDLNALDSTDAMLVQARVALLAKMGLMDSGSFGRRNAPQFLFFDSGPLVLGSSQPNRIGHSTLYPTGYPETDALELAASVPIPEYQYRCAAWHINLSGLTAIKHYAMARDGNPVPAKQSDAIDEQRALTEYVVSQIDTNFKLTGPRNCKPAFLDQALREAAFVLVKEDYESQSAACRWLRAHGLAVADNCGAYVAPTSARLPLSGRVVPVNVAPEGGMLTSAVQCKDS
jgi:predicted acylesterase/phospholipase RssA